jgi:hypothetical protein
MNSLIKIGETEVRIRGSWLRVARLEAEKYHFLDDPRAVIKGLRSSGKRIDLFTFMQRLPETAPKFDYPMELDNLAALSVSTYEHWWNEQIGFKARNKAKQAEKKGVKLREVPFSDELVRGIWEIYNESPVRQGRAFPHYGKDLETVHKEEATFLDCSTFIGAYLEDQLIGFVKLVTDQTGTQAGLMNIVSLIKHRDKAPANALVARSVRECADRKISYLVYSNFAYGKKEHDSLSDFKERSGFQRIDLPRYYVPLNSIGRAALQLGLHHKLVDRLPASTAAKLRKLRNTWNNRKFPSVTEAL